jgi:hypothetical protein
MSLYHDARIIHDPVLLTYTVFSKRHWWSMWNHVQTHQYYKGSETSGYYTKQDVALSWARNQVESILSQEVVK